ncbi:MAG: doubled motif LPXTG anchor domain-containing protein [Lachnospiraceae bacterium]|jgi:LPXTG-motif cell wall-anchored protein/uncharacterized repeat protein (TIGR02543 family)|nr:doubled motif LPXTG anchor domain-containing protein [Lachnospiraceae bacterium]
MSQKQRKSSGSKRKWSLHRWHELRRLAAFVLSFAMVFSNIGNSAAIAFAEEAANSKVEFQMTGEDIWNAAKEAVEAGSVTGGYFSFGQEDEEEAAKYRKLFAEGNLFEITEEVNYTAVPDTDGMDLRVFIRTSKNDGLEGYQLTGEEELLFLYLNSSQQTVTASLNIDGNISGTAIIKSYQEAFRKGEVPNDSEDAKEKSPEEISDQPSIEDNGDESTEVSEDNSGNESSSPEPAGENSGDESQETPGETLGEEAEDPEETLGEETKAPDQTLEESGETKEEESEKTPEETAEESKVEPAEKETEALDDDKETEASQPDQTEDDAEQAETEDGESVKPEEDTENKKEDKEDKEDNETSGQAEEGREEAIDPDSKEEASKEADSADQEKGKGEESHPDQDIASNHPAADQDLASKGREELSISANSVRMVEKGASKTYGLVAADEEATAIVVTMSLLDTGFIPQPQDLNEEVPEAVLAFLNAVAKIPAEITQENAEEVSTLLYGEVAEALEPLLGTEDFERADVQAAYDKMEAAVEAVNEALGLDAEGYYTPPLSGYDAHDIFLVNGTPESYLYLGIRPNYFQECPDNPSSAVRVKVNEQTYDQRLYTLAINCKRCGGVLIEETARWITVIPNDGHMYISNPEIINGITWSLAGYEQDADDNTNVDYNGYPALQVGFTGVKPGKTELKFHVWSNFYIDLYGRCGWCRYPQSAFAAGWTQNTETINVNVEADYILNYDSCGGSSVSPTRTSVADTSCILNVTKTIPVKTGYKFLGWADTKDAATATYQAKDPITLNWVSGSEVSKTLYAVWDDEPTSDTTYKVIREYYVNGEEAVTISVENRKGQVGDTISGKTLNTENPEWNQYTIDGNTLTFQYKGSTPEILTLTETAVNNIITLRYEYEIREEKTYSVIYRDGADGDVFGDEEHGNLKEGDKTPAFLGGTPSRKGYTFQGWYPAFNPVVSAGDAEDGMIIYTATWKKDPEESKTVKYHVEWYDTDGNQIRNAEIREADKGTVVEVTEADKVVDGYIFDAPNAKNVLSGMAEEDGKTVLKLYFTKNPEKPEMVDYKVEWYDKDGRQIKDTATRQAEKGTKVEAVKEDKLVKGYTFDATDDRNVLVSDPVDPDGNTVLKLYFIKDPDPTDPTDPTKPVEPTDPTNPTTPTEPTKPTSPTEPTNPGGSTDPTDPTNPTTPTEPTKPTSPTEPTNPGGSTDPTEPTKPTNPTEPTNPGGSTDPTEPTKPTSPTEPTNPGGSTDPTEPTKPTSPTEPTNPGGSTDPTNPTKPTSPTDPTKPGNPTDPSNPTRPTDPADPSDPTRPTDPSRPTNPTEPTRPARPIIDSGFTGGGGGNGGGGGGGSSSGGGNRDRDRDGGPGSVTAAVPTVSDEAGTPDPITINPEEVPLADLPNQENDWITIPDEEVPLASLPKTADRSMPMASLAGLMLISVFGIFGIARKRKEDGEN